MVSCGMDHSLKIWSLETEAMRKVHFKDKLLEPTQATGEF